MPGERRLGGYMAPGQLLSQKSETGLLLQRVAGKLIGTATEPLQPSRSHQCGGPLGRDPMGREELHPQRGAAGELRQSLFE
jgi:hypothetical protein